jgi:hypothetical protein
MVCFDIGYEVVHTQVTVLASVNGDTQEFSVSAPTGKTPLAGSYVDSEVGSAFGDYPDGSDWKFQFYGRPADRTVDLYVVCAAI